MTPLWKEEKGQIAVEWLPIGKHGLTPAGSGQSAPPQVVRYNGPKRLLIQGFESLDRRVLPVPRIWGPGTPQTSTVFALSLSVLFALSPVKNCHPEKRSTEESKDPRFLFATSASA